MSKRKVLVWVLGLALAAGVSAVALGAGNTQNTQAIVVTATPSKQSKTKFANIKLRSKTTTGTTGTGSFAITPVDHAVTFYDKDIRFDSKGLPQCSKSLAGLTTAQAKAACPKAIVGSGNAVVKISGDPSLPDTSTDITAFNGKPVGGHPILLLHTYSAALGTSNVVVLVGKLFKTSGKYGWKLDVTVPQLPAGTAATIFDVTVHHKPWVTRNSRRSIAVIGRFARRSRPSTISPAPGAATASGSTRAISTTRAPQGRTGPDPSRTPASSPARSSSRSLQRRPGVHTRRAASGPPFSLRRCG